MFRETITDQKDSVMVSIDKNVLRVCYAVCKSDQYILTLLHVQGGSNMSGTDLCVNKPHCTAAAQCGLFTYKSVPVIFEPPCNTYGTW